MPKVIKPKKPTNHKLEIKRLKGSCDGCDYGNGNQSGCEHVIDIETRKSCVNMSLCGSCYAEVTLKVYDLVGKKKKNVGRQ